MRKIIRLLCCAFFLFFASGQETPADTSSKSLESESIYYVIVDRFFNGDKQNDVEVNTLDLYSYHGGDFKGIVDKLPHIKDMGFTTIQLSSIFESTNYFGDQVQDYYQLNNHFGTMDDFKNLVNEAHQNNMNIILDVPINHPSTLDELPNVAHWWLEHTNVDGFFLDANQSIPDQLLETFVAQMKSTNEDVDLIYHNHANKADESAQVYHLGFNHFINQNLNEEIRELFLKPDQSLEPLFKYFETDSDANSMWKYLDDPYTSRFTYELVQQNQFPGDRWPLAITFMYTTPGVPVLFYGSEIALNGGDGAENHLLMDFRADEDLIEFIEKLGNIRNSHPSLTKGNIKLLYENGGMTIYSRTYEDETTVIALNNTSQNQTVEISAEKIGQNKQLAGLLDGDLIREQKGNYSIQINQEQSEIFVVQKKTGINMVNTMVISFVPIFFIVFFYFLWKKGKTKEVN